MKRISPFIFLVIAFCVFVFKPSNAFAALSYRSVSTDTGTSGSLSIAKPTGTTSGDILITAVSVRSSTATITAPSGWTTIQTVLNTNNTSTRLSVYYKVATGSEPSSYTWTVSTNTGVVGSTMAFSGGDTSSPIDTYLGTDTASSLSHTVGSVTPSVNGAMVLSFFEYEHSSTWTPPAGMTESSDLSSLTTPNTSGISMESDYLLQTSATATGSLTATANTNAGYGAVLTVILKPANSAPTATNLSAAETYTEDTPLNLTDIVASDVDGGNITATLTLSNTAAGSLNTGTSNAVTSTYNAGTGVWTASGAIADVNVLLAALTFTPATNFNSSFTITTSVSDGSLSATGSKTMIGVAVNDAPTATNLSAGETYTEDTSLNLTDIVVSDVDSANVTATLTLSNTAAGSFNTATSGAVTSTYNAGTGVWTASGAIANVNILLAALTFTPAANFNSPFTITTSVSDGSLSVTGSKAMTGVAVNDAPTATNLSAAETYTEDTPLNLIDIVATDVDSSSVTATLTLSNLSAGSLSTGTSGAVTSTFSTGVWTASGAIANVNTLLASVTFTPTANFNSNFVISTSVSDGVAAAVTGAKAVTGTAVNDAPTATNLSAAETYTEDVAQNLTDIIVSDVDSANVTATLTLSNAAAGSFNTATSNAVTSTYNAGTGVWTASGAIADVNTLLAALTFTPSANFSSNFTITTNVSDGALSISGSKAMTGTSVNDAPVLDASKSPTLSSVSEDASAPSGAVGTLVASLVDFASPVGQVDNVTDSDSSAQLGIAVIAQDSSLTCYYSLNGGTTWSLFGSVSATVARLLTADADNRIYCQPNADASGSFTALTFRAWDQTSGSDGGTANPSINGGTTAFSNTTDTIGLFVTPVNDAPVLDNSKSPVFNSVTEGDGAPSGAVGTLVSNLVDSATIIGGLDNVTDVDSGALYGIAVTGIDSVNTTCRYSTDSGSTWNLFGAVADDSAQLLSTTDRIYCEPNPGYSGTISDIITFRAWDQTSGSHGASVDTTTNGGTTAFSIDTDTASLTVDALGGGGGGGNTAPVAVDDAYTVEQNSSLNALDALVNDSDADDDSLSITDFTTHHGDATSTGSGFSYTPNTDFCGDDTIEYTVSDGTDTATATVTITVHCDIAPPPPPVNDSPLAVDDSFTIAINTPTLFDVRANDSDPDLDAITLTGVGFSGHANTEYSDGSILYTPQEDFCGSDSFTYTISDTSNATANATVHVTVTCPNQNPVAVDDEVTTPQREGVMIAVLDNDTDPDGDSLGDGLETQAAHGEASISPGTGVGFYTPDSDFCGTDSFTYNIDDQHGGTDIGMVTIHVTCAGTPGVPTNLGPATLINNGSTHDTQPTFTFTTSHTDPLAHVGYMFALGNTYPLMDNNTLITYESALGEAGPSSFRVGQQALGGTYYQGNPGQTLLPGTYYWIVSTVSNEGDSESALGWVEVGNDSSYSFRLSSGSSGGGIVTLVSSPLSPIGGTIGSVKTDTQSPQPEKKQPHLFLKNLKEGMTDQDVLLLQKYLNDNNFSIATTGGGSPGHETKFFGRKTTRALAAYQKAHRISPAKGYFGPVTRTQVNAVLEGQ